MEGFVKWYNRKKGFGFISGDDEIDYFVHHTALNKGTFIRDNDKVSFEPADTDKGKQAHNVSLLQKASEMENQPQKETPQEAPLEESTSEE